MFGIIKRGGRCCASSVSRQATEGELNHVNSRNQTNGGDLSLSFGERGSELNLIEFRQLWNLVLNSTHHALLTAVNSRDTDSMNENVLFVVVWKLVSCFLLTEPQAVNKVVILCSPFSLSRIICMAALPFRCSLCTEINARSMCGRKKTKKKSEENWWKGACRWPTIFIYGCLVSFSSLMHTKW